MFIDRWPEDMTPAPPGAKRSYGMLEASLKQESVSLRCSYQEIFGTAVYKHWGPNGTCSSSACYLLRTLRRGHEDSDADTLDLKRDYQ
jgi:hypothetical protein